MANANWVCFDCQDSVRRPILAEAVSCLQCGNGCRNLGTKICIPSKADNRSWKRLRESIREVTRTSNLRIEGARVRDRHRLERQIAELKSASKSKQRARMIEQLQERLALL
jgi:hypothetical protein